MRHISGDSSAAAPRDSNVNHPTRNISIVIPAFNEELGLEETLGELTRSHWASNFDDVQVIVVDDGSEDSTAAVATAHGVALISHPTRAGYGQSLKDGIAIARHETVVTIDGDGTYPVDAIPALVAQLDDGFDLSIGRRRGPHLGKGVLRILLKLLVQFASGRHVGDVNSGLRAMRRSEVLPLFKNLSNSFSFSTSTTLAYLMLNRFVSFHDIEYRKRIGKTRVKLLRDSLRTLQYIFQAIAYYNPVKFVLLPCAFLTVLCTVLLVMALLSIIPYSAFAVCLSVICVGVFSLLVQGAFASARR